MMIKEFGGRVASVWDGLRPMTKKMLVGALQSSNSTPLNNKAPNFSYDAHADWAVSRLLTALDEQLYSSSAANALEQKAYEFDSDEARDILDRFDSESEMRGD